MQIRSRIAVGLTAAALLALLATGCSDEDDSSEAAPTGTEPVLTRVVEGETPPVLEPAGGATVVAEPGLTETPEVIAPGVSGDVPPVTMASAGGASVEMGIGTYCWGNVCVDKIGPVTRGTLTIASGDEIVVAIPAPGLTSVDVSASEATQPFDLENGERAWSVPAVDSITLPSAFSESEVRFEAALEPGTYVLTVGMFFESGDVQYGVVLEVQ